jgi:hypothetical protein
VDRGIIESTGTSSTGEFARLWVYWGVSEVRASQRSERLRGDDVTEVRTLFTLIGQEYIRVENAKWTRWTGRYRVDRDVT